jgi:hypothetical protein
MMMLMDTWTGRECQVMPKARFEEVGERGEQNVFEARTK